MQGLASRVKVYRISEEIMNTVPAMSSSYPSKTPAKKQPVTEVVEVRSTTNYGLFNFSPLNRPIDPRHLAKLVVAIQEKNLLRDNPIAVDHNGCVVDGQHRLKAAEQLGVPIYYQFTVDMTIEDAAKINGPVKKWTLKDRLSVQIGAGNPEYIKLNQFCIRYPWLSLAAAIDLTYYGDRVQMDFATGGYKCNDLEFAEEVIHAVLDFAEYIPYYRETPFVSAVKHLLEHAEYDHRRMVEKLKYNSSMLHKCTNSLDYLKVFEGIYNYKTTEKYRANFERLPSASRRRRADRIRRQAKLQAMQSSMGV